MSVETNKAVVRRYNDEVWGRGNVAVIDELCDPAFVLHSATAGTVLEVVEAAIARGTRPWTREARG